MKKITLLVLLLISSICFAQRKETVSGTFFNIYYPNGEHLVSNTAKHTISSSKGHIVVTVPAGFVIDIYQFVNGADRGVFINPQGDRYQSKTYEIQTYYGGPDYTIKLTYPEGNMVNQTIVYDIDFYYYDNLYANDIEPNNDKETAMPISENIDYEGWSHSYDIYEDGNSFQDYYKITAKKNGAYTVNFKKNNTLITPNLNISYITNGTNNVPRHFVEYPEGNTGNTMKINCVGKGDVFYVSVNGFCSYQLNYSVEESKDENDFEPNDTFESAIELSENNINRGTIGYGDIFAKSSRIFPKDSEDFYKIVPTKNGKLIVNFKEKIDLPENFVTIYEKLPHENFLRAISESKVLSDYNQTFEVDCASPDKTYYLEVNHIGFYNSPTYSCCNAYEISWNIENTTNTNCEFNLSNTDFEFNNTFSISPNPVSDTLQLAVANNQTVQQITITDITGKTVLTIQFNNTTIDIKKLSSGIYFLQATIDGKTITKKFIKQ